MKRRSLVAGIAGSTLLSCNRLAQSQGTAPTLVILSPGSSPTRVVFAAFRDRLRELGYIENRNLIVQFHLTHGDFERLPAVAREIALAAPAVVLADGGAAATAMWSASQSIPIVAIGSIDPDLRTLATSLARPGGNVTGISTFAVEIPSKQLEVLLEIVPAARRIAALGIQTEQARQPLRTEATRRGVQVEFTAAGVAADVERMLSSAALAGVDGVVVSQNPVLSAMGAGIVQRINASRRPAVYVEREYIDAGGLAAFGVNFQRAFQRLAYFVDRILKGAKPADLPIERPERLELVINLRTARLLDLEMPRLLLARADEVIE